MVAVGGADPKGSAALGPNAMTAHQALDASATGGVAFSPQSGMDTGGAIALAMLVMNASDLLQQMPVGRLARALRPCSPSIIARR